MAVNGNFKIKITLNRSELSTEPVALDKLQTSDKVSLRHGVRTKSICMKLSSLCNLRYSSAQRLRTMFRTVRFCHWRKLRSPELLSVESQSRMG